MECPACAGREGWHLSTWRLFSSDLQDLIGGSGLSQETLCQVGFQTLAKERVRQLLGWSSEGELYGHVPGGYIIPYPELGADKIPHLDLRSWDQAEPPYWRIRMRAQTAGEKDSIRKKAPRYLGPTARPPRLFVPLIPPFTDGYLSGAGELYLCYAEDTELLTPAGWVAFPKLASSDLVAQWHTDGCASFVSPQMIQKWPYDGPMMSIKADWSSLLVTPNHRVIAHYENCHPRIYRADEIKRAMMLPVAGQMESANPRLLTVPQVRLLAAYLADGTNPKIGRRYVWNFKKERKKERLTRLLAELGITADVHSFPSALGWTMFFVNRDRLPFLFDELGWDSLDWPLAIRQEFLHELGYWDGDFNGTSGVRFFTARPQEAEIVSAMAAISGWGSILHCDQRPSRPEQLPQYVVSLVPRSERRLGYTPEPEHYEGNVWCCTVPTGFLITRRHGRVTVAGNTEGEKKALKLTQDGLPAVCYPGIHGWLRSGDDSPRERFVGPRDIWRRPVRLLYDSDITRDHKAGWPAYQRLSGVLMTFGATSCEISTTPLPKEP